MLDPVKNTLNPKLWDIKSELMLPEVSREIVERLFRLLDRALVKSLWLIGSNAGVQWNTSSDIDIQVVTRIPPGRESRDAIAVVHKLFKEFNGGGQNYLSASMHPINYFVVPDIEMNYSKDVVSVYLITDFERGLEDIWVRPYIPAGNIRSPKDRFFMDELFARMLSRKLRRDVLDVETELNRFGGDLEEIIEELSGLVSSYDQVDRRRKLPYSVGWGIPKVSPSNFVYKYLERENLLELMDAIKHIIKKK